MNFRRYVMMCPSIFSLNREALLVNETAKHCLSMKPRSTACQWVGNCHFIIQISMNAKCFSIILEVSTNSLLPPASAKSMHGLSIRPQGKGPGVRPSGHTSRGLIAALGPSRRMALPPHNEPQDKGPGVRPSGHTSRGLIPK